MARSIEEILRDVRINEIPLKKPMTATLETSLEEAYELLEASPHGALLVLEGSRGANHESSLDLRILEPVPESLQVRLIKRDQSDARVLVSCFSHERTGHAASKRAWTVRSAPRPSMSLLPSLADRCLVSRDRAHSRIDSARVRGSKS